jgi:hypothetical protein
MENTLNQVKAGFRVTIRVPGGIGRDGIEWVERTGTAVMSGPAGWVLNMGGRYGTPGIATPESFVSHDNGKALRAKANRQARHEAFTSCGMVRVRVNGKVFYE